MESKVQDIEFNRLYFEKNLATMARMKDNTVDLLATDAPYGYNFMGKDWDKAVPPVEVWKECYRVMKPGAFGFIMSAPRQDVLSHMIVNLDAAGFDTSFTSIYWAYASGFPKAMNISKAIDKKFGMEREVIGIKEHPTSKDRTGNKSPYQNEQHLNGKSDITAPASDKAKELDGSYAGFQPKPAVEIIIVVMKPLSEKSYTSQAMVNGKGVTWLDDCRIPVDMDIDDKRLGGNGSWSTHKAAENIYSGGYAGKNVSSDERGRFPANLIVSDDVLNDGCIYASGEMDGEQGGFGNSENDYGKNSKTPKAISYGDSGSFSRYYDVDKWWDERINGLPDKVKEVFPFLINPKASKSEKDFGVTGADKFFSMRPCATEESDRGTISTRLKSKMGKNNHPTVKPVKLMSYLVTLGSREGDVVYDPYAGTGTTLIAAKLLGRNFIGSECDEESFETAQQRLKPFTSQPQLF